MHAMPWNSQTPWQLTATAGELVQDSVAKLSLPHGVQRREPALPPHALLGMLVDSRKHPPLLSDPSTMNKRSPGLAVHLQLFGLFKGLLQRLQVAAAHRLHEALRRLHLS